MTRRTAVRAALLLSLAASPATAFDLSAMQIGTVVRWRTEDGNTSVTYLGPDGRDGYKFAFLGEDPGGRPYRATWWSTRDGQLVRILGPGIDDRFRPYDCSLTPGRCTFTLRHAFAPRERRIRISEVREGRWFYREYSGREDEAHLVEEGSFTVDSRGFVIDSKWTLFDGTVLWTQQMNR